MFEPFLIVALEGTEQIVTIPSMTYWTSFGYLWLEIFDRMIMQFLNPALPDWYDVDYRVATATGTLGI